MGSGGRSEGVVGCAARDSDVCLAGGGGFLILVGILRHVDWPKGLEETEILVGTRLWHGAMADLFRPSISFDSWALDFWAFEVEASSSGGVVETLAFFLEGPSSKLTASGLRLAFFGAETGVVLRGPEVSEGACSTSVCDGMGFAGFGRVDLTFAFSTFRFSLSSSRAEGLLGNATDGGIELDASGISMSTCDSSDVTFCELITIMGWVSSSSCIELRGEDEREETGDSEEIVESASSSSNAKVYAVTSADS